MFVTSYLIAYVHLSYPTKPTQHHPPEPPKVLLTPLATLPKIPPPPPPFLPFCGTTGAATPLAPPATAGEIGTVKVTSWRRGDSRSRSRAGVCDCACGLVCPRADGWMRRWDCCCAEVPATEAAKDRDGDREGRREGFGGVRGGDRGGGGGANMIGMSAISTPTLLAPPASSRATFFRERCWDSLLDVSGLGNKGANASSQLPSLSSTSLSSSVCRVAACWSATVRREEARVRQFEILRVVREGKWRVAWWL